MFIQLKIIYYPTYSGVQSVKAFFPVKEKNYGRIHSAVRDFFFFSKIFYKARELELNFLGEKNRRIRREMRGRLKGDGVLVTEI